MTDIALLDNFSTLAAPVQNFFLLTYLCLLARRKKWVTRPKSYGA